MRFFIIIVSLLFSSLSHAQSIADLARKAEEEKNPLHIYADVSSFQNGLAIASKYTEDGEYKYGVVDEEGVVYIPVNYDEISLFKEGSNYRDNVYKCQRNGKLGLVNAQDITLLQCEYSSIKHSGEYVYLVKNGKNGYAELKGTDEVKLLIPCIYDKLESYSKNAPMRATYNGKEGMIDGNNKIIIPFEYSNIGKFYNVGAYNMAWVEQDGKYGIYNIDGTVIQPWDIEKAYVMNENSGTTYLTFDDFPDPSTPYIHIVVNGMTGVLSGKTYKTVIPCKYGYISPVINERAFYKANNKWGIMDIQNNSIQEAIYDKIKINNNMLSEAFTPDGTFHDNMYVFIGDKQGMIDKNGKAFIPVKYDSLGVFSENMIVAKCGNLYGYINSNGEECIPLTYSHADNFSEGLAAVKNEKGKYLFIDASGVMVIKPHEYDRVGHFQNGTCKVYRKDKVWEIDREGKKVKNSKKKVEVGNVDENKSNDDMYVENCENVSDTNTVYDKDLASTPTVISTSQPNNIQLSQNFSSNISKYDAVLGNFSDGLLPVTKNKKLGYINAEGEEVIPCTKKYYIEPGMDDGIVKYGSFHDGLAQVYSFEGESGAIESQGAKNIKIGYMNKLGETVIPAIYDYADDFSEGKAYVRSNDFQGFIDTTGKRLFQCKQSPNDMYFSDGLVLIFDYDDGKYIFYNSEGKIALEIPTDKYSELHGFNDGLAYYEKINNETGGIGEKGFIDKSGKEVLVLSEFYIVNDFSEGLASVSKDGEMYGFINTKGDLVIPCKYKGYIDEGDIRYFHDFHDGVCLIAAEDSLYFINKKNEVVLNINKNLSCSDMDSGVALVTEYDNATNISTYGIVCINGYNTLDHQDNDLALQRIESLKVQQKIEAEKSRKEQEERDLEEKRRIEERRRIEEIQKQNSLQLGAIPNKFTSYADVFKLIYPSKKFYFNRASSIYGIDVWFKGYLEIRANKDNGTLSIFANGIKISELYNRGNNYESVDVKDKMVRLFVRDSYDDYPLIIHLSDSKENKPYIYFEPMRGTDFRGDFDIRYRNRVLWQWVEPDVGSNSAHIIFHPTSEVEPTPIRYVMK